MEMRTRSQSNEQALLLFCLLGSRKRSAGLAAVVAGSRNLRAVSIQFARVVDLGALNLEVEGDFVTLHRPRNRGFTQGSSVGAGKFVAFLFQDKRGCTTRTTEVNLRVPRSSEACGVSRYSRQQNNCQSY